MDTSNQSGSHWVFYYRNKNDRIYFDPYGLITPSEIQQYLKTGSEFDRGKEVIQRNTDIVQASNASVCGYLCPFVLKSLTSGEHFQKRFYIICSTMVDIHKVIGNIPVKPKKGFVLPKYRFTWSYNPLRLQLDSQDNPLPREEPYNAVDDISMHDDICYRDNDTPAGKREYARKMLAELNALVPKGWREKVDRQGTKYHWIET